MKDKRPKVKQLATELGVSSRQVILRCRAEGLTVQNRVSRLTLDQEKTIRTWFASPSEDPVND